MTSQASQGSFPSSLLLPLSKFSHATSSRLSEGQIPWIHLSSQNDLFVVFDVRVIRDVAGHAEEHQFFKIIRDPNILEDIDLRILAQEAQRAALEFKTAQDLRSNPQVAVLVRKPCIAVKYPVDNGTFRRFQVRFTKEEDYYETMKIFTRAGVPVLEAGNIPKQQEQPSYRPITTGPQQISNIGPSHPQQLPTSLNFGQALSTVFPSSSVVHNKVAPQTLLSPSISIPHHAQFSQHTSPAMQAQHQTMSDRQFAAEVSRRSIHDHGVYSNAPSISISSQPQHIAPSSINVYTPRPSTAPEVTSPPAKDVMPPRRELPFVRKEKPVSKSGEKDDATDSGQATERVRPAGRLSTDEREAIHSCSQPTIQAAKTAAPKSRKRAAPKPKKTPAPKKSKTTVSHPEAATEEQTPIPSAAELIGHTGEVVPTIDTQRLYSVAEVKATASKKTRKTLPPSPEPIYNDQFSPIKANAITANHMKPSQSQLAEITSEQVQESIPTPQIPSQNQPCTPADQLIQAPIHTITSSPSSSPDKDNEHATRTSQFLHTGIPPSNQGSNPRPRPQPHLTTVPTTTTTTTDTTFPTISPPLPFFTESTSKLKDFTALPSNQQHEIIEKFICQSLDDENFKTLCKTMEGVWARTLCLKP